MGRGNEKDGWLTMFPMDRKPTPVTVEYNSFTERSDRRGSRTRKTFPDAYTARRFYVAKFAAGANPKVVRTDSESTMSNNLPSNALTVSLPAGQTEIALSTAPKGRKKGPTVIAAAPGRYGKKFPTHAASDGQTETATEAPPAAEPKKKAPKPKAKATPAAAPKGRKKGATPAPAKGAKKTTAVAPKAAETAAKKGGLGLGKPRTAILKALATSREGLTRGQISEETGINSGFTSLLGHIEADKREEGSLSLLGFIKPEKRLGDDEKIVYVWVITAAGRKALEKAEKNGK